MRTLMGVFEGVAKEALFRFIERHPRIGGGVFLAFGLLLGFLDASIETERARFWDGEQVTGTVLEFPAKLRNPHSHEIIVKWLDSSGNSHRKAFDLYRYEFERLQVGGTVELVLAAQDQSKAAMVAHVAPLGVPPQHTVAGISFSSKIWFPLLCIVMGISFIVYFRE